jgi:molybdopterin adenylyltransferase
MIRVAILTVSDSRAASGGADPSGDLIAAWISDSGHTLAARATVPDETVAIASTIAGWCDNEVAQLVVTTGGTGLGPRDVTPEATRAILDREAPGIASAIHLSNWPGVPTSILSRALAGNRGQTLIVNLPGSPNGVRAGLDILTLVAEHAVQLLAGHTEH